VGLTGRQHHPPRIPRDLSQEIVCELVRARHALSASELRAGDLEELLSLTQQLELSLRRPATISDVLALAKTPGEQTHRLRLLRSLRGGS